MMASSRKYAELLDIDPEAPDIFETPDLTDDNSTIPTSTSPPPESSSEDIDRHHIDPDEARTHFLSPDDNDGSTIRARSTRIGYLSRSKRRTKEGAEANGDELSSDEEQEESVERKLARLRREVAEVKGEVEKRTAESDGKPVQDEKETQEIEALSEVLKTVSPASTFGGEHGAASRLTKRLAAAASAPSATSASSAPQSQPAELPPSTESSTTYTVTYAPTYNPTHTLAKITSFDTRLTALESALGIDTLPLPTQDRPASKAVLPTLDALSRQLTTLTTSTDTSLDTISRRVRQLTSDTQSLESARKAAAQESSPSSPPTHDPTTTTLPPSTIPKLHALYSTLPTIESLAPLLPPTLDRLRSLRALHADAGSASETLRRIEIRQTEVRAEIKGWREGLERVEVGVREGAGGMRENAGVVEGWVRELESRLDVLGRGGEGGGEGGGNS